MWSFADGPSPSGPVRKKCLCAGIYHYSFQGWGMKIQCQSFTTTNHLLQEVSMKVISDNKCRKANGKYNDWEDDEKICKLKTGDYKDLIKKHMLCGITTGETRLRSKVFSLGQILNRYKGKEKN